MVNMNVFVMENSPIRFPGLFGDWAFTAPSRAISLGAGGVYWYGILITLGVVLATLFCMKQKEKYGISEDNLLDGLLWGIPTGVIGARIYYVIFYLSMFRDNSGKFLWYRAIAFWDGGLAIYGAVIAILLTIYVLSRVKHFKFFALTDLVVMGLLIGQSMGRWGNFMNREAFGAETDIFCRMQLTLRNGALIEVHPTFLYESLWNLAGLLLLVLVLAPRRKFDGQNTWFYFLWYGIGRFWIEGLRSDSLYLFNWELFGEPIRVSQALSALMALAAAIMLIYHLWLHPHSPEELYVNQLKAQKTADRKAATAAEAEDMSVDAIIDEIAETADETVKEAAE